MARLQTEADDIFDDEPGDEDEAARACRARIYRATQMFKRADRDGLSRWSEAERLRWDDHELVVEALRVAADPRTDDPWPLILRLATHEPPASDGFLLMLGATVRRALTLAELPGRHERRNS